MLNNATIEIIGKVSTKKDFDKLLERFKTSDAPLGARQEAMRELKAQHPKFDAVDKLPSKELYAELKDGEADISDMGGFGS